MVFWNLIKNKNAKRFKLTIGTELSEVCEYAHVIVVKANNIDTKIDEFSLKFKLRQIKKRKPTAKDEKTGP